MPAGRPVLIMDGATANRPGRTYGIFDYRVYLKPGVTNVLPFTIWMPLLDTQHAVPIPVPTPRELVVTSPRIPGLEVRIPADVMLQTVAGPLASMSLTQIPVDRPPFPLPDGTTFFFTPQAHGALVKRPDGTASPAGVRFILPNVNGAPAGSRVDLVSYDTTGAWHVYGQGTVSADGRQIVPDPGVEFHRVTCIFVLAQLTHLPPLGPVLGGVRACDPLDPATGLFVYEKTDLVVPDVIPIVITRKYRQGDADPRLFGTGASLDYQMLLVGDGGAFAFAYLLLGDGARIRYDRISPGTGYTDAVMEATKTPTKYYKSRLLWNASRSAWDVTFLDGTIYRFTGSGAPGPYLTEIQDRAGNRLTITRGGYGWFQITRIASPSGRWVDFTYGANGYVAQVRDNAGRTVSYTYDPTTPIC